MIVFEKVLSVLDEIVASNCQNNNNEVFYLKKCLPSNDCKILNNFLAANDRRYRLRDYDATKIKIIIN